MDILGVLENRDLLQVIRTAGLDLVKLKKGRRAIDNLNEYYAELDRWPSQNLPW